MRIRIYTAEDVQLLSEVQTIALSTSLPIVMTIFKNFYAKSESGKPLWIEFANLTMKEIDEKAKNDMQLYTQHYSSSKFVKGATFRLLEKGFLKQDETEISLTDKGRKVFELLIIEGSITKIQQKANIACQLSKRNSHRRNCMCC